MRALSPEARLTGWIGFVLFLTALQLWGRYFADAPRITEPLYSERVLVGNVVQWSFVLAVVAGLSAGAGQLLALRRPRHVGRAVWIAVGTFLLVAAVGAALQQLGLSPREEQGLIPTTWPPPDLAVLAGNAVFIVLVGPLLEELIFRGVGFSLLARFGPSAAVLLSSLAFAVVHGLVQGFVVIFLLGVGLGLMRHVSGSVWPCFVFHALFNGGQLAVALAVAASG